MIRDIFDFPVTQRFGPTPLEAEPSYAGFPHFHEGVDLGLPVGTPVPAEGAGTIESVFEDPTGGRQVKVKYDTGAEGWFAHLSRIFVHEGQPVSAQTEIAESGASGDVTGPHLHFQEYDPSGQLVDPLSDAGRTYIGGSSSPHDEPKVGPLPTLPLLGGVEDILGAPAAIANAIAGAGTALVVVGAVLIIGVMGAVILLKD